METSFLGIMYFVALSHGVMLFILLLKKSIGVTAGQPSPGKWLVIIAGIICYKLYEGAVLHTGLFQHLYHTMDLLPGMVLFIGPLLWGYANQIAGKPAPPSYLFALHFIPALAMWYLNASSVFASAEQKIAMWNYVLNSTNHQMAVQYVLLFLGIKVHLGTYLFFSWRTLQTWKAATQDLRADNSSQVLTGIQFLIVSFFALETLWVTLFIGQQYFAIGTLATVGHIWLLFVAFMVMAIGFVGLQKPDLVFTSEERKLIEQQLENNNKAQSEDDKVKYLHSALAEDTGALLSKELEQQIEAQQLFLNEKLTLTELAKAVDIKAHTLSQIINQSMKTNFYKLINGYRIQFAIGLIEDNRNNWSLERIAYESGFANRVTFSKAFKEVMDCTPSAYKKQHVEAS